METNFTMYSSPIKLNLVLLGHEHSKVVFLSNLAQCQFRYQDHTLPNIFSPILFMQ